MSCWVLTTKPTALEILAGPKCSTVYNVVKWSVDSRCFGDSREAEKPEENVLGLHGCGSVGDVVYR